MNALNVIILSMNKEKGMCSFRVPAGVTLLSVMHIQLPVELMGVLLM